MHIGRLRPAQNPEQGELGKGRFEQIGPSHDLSNTLICIVKGNGQVIADQSIAAPDQEITVL